MNLHLIMTTLLFICSIGVNAKSKKNKVTIPIPQFSISGGSSSSPALISPGMNPYFYNTPAYGELLLNQYEEKMNAITNSIGQPQSDLGSQYLDKQIQKDITDDLKVQPIHSESSMPMYRITSIIDHGRAGNTKNAKFKNVDYLLWKFQNLEEGYSVLVNGDRLVLGAISTFEDKPDSILNFIQKEKQDYFLLESRANDVISGFLVKAKSKQVFKVECTKVLNSEKNLYEYVVLSEEKEFWNYVGLFK